MDNYQKHKERTPEETVFVIQKILRDIGLFPVLRWTGINKKGQFSNRITLYPTAVGVNGKGTDELYSTASGYGELMERLQNNMLLSGSRNLSEAPFIEAPDEKEIPLKDLLENPDPFTAHVLDALKDEDADSNGKALYSLYSYKKNGQDVLTALPFADPANGRVVYVPIYPTRRFTGSNGMSAGNTMEEALVQGLSEIFERQAHSLIYEGKVVPPEIPDEALKPYSFYPVIQRLRSNERFKVRILDCSLGRGWPVVALCIHDLANGTFGFNVGAHPSFPIAVERTLTESAQGRVLEQFTSLCKVGLGGDPFCNANRVTIMSMGEGKYPASLFYGKPGWEYRPWTRFKGPGNREYLKEMLQLLKEEGHKPLIRDVSFLGFPACHILVPEFKHARSIEGTSVRLKRTVMRADSDWSHFPKYTDEQAYRLLSLIRYYELTMKGMVGTLFGMPAAVAGYTNNRLGAMLALRLEDFPTAMHFLDAQIPKESEVEERRYLNCLKQYAKMRNSGLTGEQAHDVLRSLYTSKAAERACNDTEDLSLILEKCYKPLNCPNCEGCPLHEKGCMVKEENELYCKVRTAMGKGKVSQESLLNMISEMW